jgi:hypothetical protein
MKEFHSPKRSSQPYGEYILPLHKIKCITFFCEPLLLSWIQIRISIRLFRLNADPACRFDADAEPNQNFPKLRRSYRSRRPQRCIPWTKYLYRHQTLNVGVSYKLTSKGTWRQVFISLWPPPLLCMTPYSPPLTHCIRVYSVSY